MLNVLIWLFLGWLLGLFGFKGTLITGMNELFGLSLTGSGYYTLFAFVGAIKSVVWSITAKREL